MITLYQRGEITRQIIRNKQLTKCQLAFSFCIFENGEYKRVSPIYYSDVIEDSKIQYYEYSMHASLFVAKKSTNTKKKVVKGGSKRLNRKFDDKIVF